MSETKYLDKQGLSYLWGKLKDKFDNKTDKVSHSIDGDFASLDEQGNLVDSGKKAADFKTVQTAVSDPSADGEGVSFIDSVSQDTNGVITPHKKNVRAASTTESGLMSAEDKVKLNGISTGATKVEVSETNGNIKIDGTETTVYTHPSTGAVAAAAVKVGRDSAGHVVIGDALAKNDVGLGNVDNTSDASIKAAFAGTISDGDTGFVNGGDAFAALGGKIDRSERGASNGVATLDASGLIPSGQLPSYVDDVVEAYPVEGATELTAGWLSATDGGSALIPATGKIYVLMDDSESYTSDSQFRWDGTAYVKLSDGGVSEMTDADLETLISTKEDYFYMRSLEDTDGTIEVKRATPNTMPNWTLEYSTDKVNWTSKSFTNNTTWQIPFPAGSRIYFRSSSGSIGRKGAGSRGFYSDKKFAVGGSVAKLTDNTMPQNYEYFDILRNSTNLTQVDKGFDINTFFDGNGNFYGCKQLTTVEIPLGTTSIPRYAFAYCGLTSVTIPDGVTSIGIGAFTYCPLTSVNIPNSVKSIDESAFSHTMLTSITIPGNVKSIGKGAFYECTRLTSVTIQSGVTSIGDYAFGGCQETLDMTVEGTVTTIGPEAFNDILNVKYNGTAVSSVWGAKGINGYIENGVVYDSIEKKSLYGVTKTFTGEFVIPSSVTSIGHNAFKDCTELTSVTIPNGVTSIGDYAFKKCSKLTSIIIPDGVASIGDSSFSDCSNLTSISIPDSVTSIGINAFGSSGLSSVPTMNGVTVIPNNAFSSCKSLSSVVIANNVTSIGKQAFVNCFELSSVLIPNGVTSIGSEAFRFCSKISNIEVPNSVTSIGSNAFGNVFNVVYHGTATGSPWGAKNFNKYIEDGFMYDSSEKKVLYGAFNATGALSIPSGVEMIADNAFENSGITGLVVPSSVNTIGNGAFQYCSDLSSITLQNGIVTIGDMAFYSCYELTAITIPSSVESIGSMAFEGCDNLTSVILSEGLESIGEGAFDMYWEEGGTITIPSTVTYLGDYSMPCGGGFITFVVKAIEPPEIDGEPFIDYGEGIAIQVPEGSVNAYKEAAGWSECADYIEAIPEE